MVTVPSFLLRRLYVKESLRNTADGFEFEMRNQLGSGYAFKVHPLTVDGVEVAVEHCSFVLDEDTIDFADVSNERTLTLAMNKSLIIKVSGARLEPGHRKIGMGFDVPGLGTLRFDFTDTVADG